MIRSRRYLFVLYVLSVLISPTLRTETPSSNFTAKLHPSLRTAAASHAPVFSGANVFDAYGGSPAEIGVLVHTTDIPALRRSGIRVQSECGSFATARIRVSDLETLAQMPGVEWVDPGSINYPQCDVSVPETGALLVHGGYIGGASNTGKGALVMIFDSGIDIKHAAFRDPNDPTRSRILSIWDQTLTPAGSEASPQGFTYGVEYTKGQIEGELKTVPAGVVRHADTYGHGTNVAGVAVGGGRAGDKRYMGMAPEAGIIVVKGGNGSFTEAGIIDGLQYADNVAVKYGKPIVVNWSFGTQSGPHDGTSTYATAVNKFVSKNGRVVCIAAGNAGTSPIHRSGSLAQGASDTIAAIVPAYTASPGTNNDAFILDVWMRSTQQVTARAISPTGLTYERAADTDGDHASDADGTITVWNHTAAAPRVNRNIQLYVHDKTASVPKQGTWKFVLTNGATQTVQYDVWLTSRSVGNATVTLSGGDSKRTVTEPATAAGAITIGSYVTKWSWPSIIGQYAFPGSTDRTGNISTISGIGPTADGRMKPELVAPGQGIFTAFSASAGAGKDSFYTSTDGKYYFMNSTSMAVAHASGACALLLSADPGLTAAQVKSHLQSSANTDSYTAAGSADAWGSGKLDIAEAVARVVTPGAQVSRMVLAYDSAGGSYYYTLTAGRKYAVRLSPQASGVITRAIVSLPTSSVRPIIGSGAIVCELFTNAGGSPGSRIGTAVSLPLASLCAGTFNTIPLASASLPVEKGGGYFLVISLSNDADTLKPLSDVAVTNVRSMIYKNGAWGGAENNFRFRAELTTTLGAVGVAQDEGVPLEFIVHQNYPNPFNPSTRISYTTPKKGRVTLTVFDILGRTVSTLVNEEESAGRHTAVWNGRTSSGMPASAGVYVYRLEAGGLSRSNKMILLK